MGRLADEIERYIKELLAESPTGQVEVRRNALALRFGCVPAQINYVLSTRFTIWHGFYVESRRGGGGFLRISKLPPGSPDALVYETLRICGGEVSQIQALALIERLRAAGLISGREANLMREVVSTGLKEVVLPLRNRIRAVLLRVMLTALFGREGQSGN
jgi:transcriptional regulator CtsR